MPLLAGAVWARPPADTPRTAQDAVDDLTRLLTNAELDGPYVLVGHSFGGHVVRLFAAQPRW